MNVSDHELLDLIVSLSEILWSRTDEEGRLALEAAWHEQPWHLAGVRLTLGDNVAYLLQRGGAHESPAWFRVRNVIANFDWMRRRLRVTELGRCQKVWQARLYLQWSEWWEYLWRPKPDEVTSEFRALVLALGQENLPDEDPIGEPA